MKTVRLKNSVVAEIIPDCALPVAQWYGEDFAAQCMEAPDDVEQGMVYDLDTKTFSVPPVPAPEPDALTQTQLAVAELAETESAHDLENKLAIAELAETLLGGTNNG